jgi:predicted transcriptional regulator
MQTILTEKRQVAELLTKLPDESTLEDIQYHLYVLEKIRRGQAEIATGEQVSHEQAIAHFSQWQ